MNNITTDLQLIFLNRWIFFKLAERADGFVLKRVPFYFKIYL